MVADVGGWERQLPLAGRAGDVGGDVQVGEAFGARWARRLDGGLWAVVTRSYYPAELHGARYLECDTEYLVCTDLSDPGGTEQWSDGRAVPCTGNPTGEGACNAAVGALGPDDGEWNTFAPRWAVAS